MKLLIDSTIFYRDRWLNGDIRCSSEEHNGYRNKYIVLKSELRDLLSISENQFYEMLSKWLTK